MVQKMSHSGERKSIIDVIYEKNRLVIGEFNVIPRDVLMRFINVKVAMDKELIKISEELLQAIFDIYPKISGKEDIQLNIPMGHRYTKFIYVVDPQTLYIPYHYHVSELYGIYIREKIIREDLKNFIGFAWELLKNERFYERLRVSAVDKSDIQSLMKHPGLSLSILLALYMEALYSHALAHHVLEDVSTLFEINDIDQYSIIRDSREEEAFCEYVMYLALKGEIGWNEPGGGYALRLLHRLRDIMVIPPVSFEDLTRFLKAYRKVFAPILYIYRNKVTYTKYQFLKPAVSEDVAKKLSIVFRSFWMTHIHEWEPIRVSIDGKEIVDRIYIIDL